MGLQISRLIRLCWSWPNLPVPLQNGRGTCSALWLCFLWVSSPLNSRLALAFSWKCTSTKEWAKIGPQWGIDILLFLLIPSAKQTTKSGLLSGRNCKSYSQHCGCMVPHVCKCGHNNLANHSRILIPMCNMNVFLFPTLMFWNLILNAMRLSDETI